MTDPDLELVSIERHVLETLEECVRKGVRHSDAADAAWEALAPKPEQDWRQERADKITWPRKGLLLCPECNAEPWTDCENCKGRGVIDPSTTRDAVPPSIADMAPGTKNGPATADVLRSQGPHPKVTVLPRNEDSLPPSTDEMAPGTTFRGHLSSFPTQAPLLLVTVGHMTVCKVRSGEMYSALDVDPSTIRDVTVPNAPLGGDRG